MRLSFWQGFTYMAGVLVCWEVYLHFQEPISEQIGGWLDTAQSRFKVFYAEWRRLDDQDD